MDKRPTKCPRNEIVFPHRTKQGERDCRIADIIGSTDFGEGLAGGLPSQGLSDLMRGEFGLPTKSNPLAPMLELGQRAFDNLRVALGVDALGPKCSKAVRSTTAEPFLRGFDFGNRLVEDDHLI